MSVFTEILKRYGELSEAADNGTATSTQFIELQRLDVRVMDARNAGYINERQYRALSSAYFDIKENFQAVLGLNRHQLTGSGKA